MKLSYRKHFIINVEPEKVSHLTSKFTAFDKLSLAISMWSYQIHISDYKMN